MTAIRVERQALGHDRPQPPGHPLRDPHVEARRDLPLDRRGVVEVGEGKASGQHLVRDQREAVDVAAGVEWMSGEQFGRLVGERTGGAPGLLRRHVDRDAEVGKHRVAAVVEKNVDRLHVAVCPAGDVDRVERGGDLPRPGNRPRDGHAAPVRVAQLLGQRAARHQLGDDKHRAARVVANVEDLEDVGMLQARDQPRLVEEVVAVALGEFHGHVAADERVMGEPHVALGPPADLPLDAVAAVE